MSRTNRRRPAAPVEPVIAAEPAPYVPSKEFANYPLPHCEAGPVGMIWREGERYPSWALPLNSPREFRNNYPKPRGG